MALPEASSRGGLGTSWAAAPLCTACADPAWTPHPSLAAHPQHPRPWAAPTEAATSSLGQRCPPAGPAPPQGQGQGQGCVTGFLVLMTRALCGPARGLPTGEWAPAALGAGLWAGPGGTGIWMWAPGGLTHLFHIELAGAHSAVVGHVHDTEAELGEEPHVLAGEDADVAPTPVLQLLRDQHTLPGSFPGGVKVRGGYSMERVQGPSPLPRAHGQAGREQCPMQEVLEQALIPSARGCPMCHPRLPALGAPAPGPSYGVGKGQCTTERGRDTTGMGMGEPQGHGGRWAGEGTLLPGSPVPAGRAWVGGGASLTPGGMGQGRGSRGSQQVAAPRPASSRGLPYVL